MSAEKLVKTGALGEALPQRTIGDIVLALVKGGISGIPFAGGFAAEGLALIFRPPLEKRLDRWFNTLNTAIEELKCRVTGLTPELLSQNEVFITTAVHATKAASRTHQVSVIFSTCLANASCRFSRKTSGTILYDLTDCAA